MRTRVLDVPYTDTSAGQLSLAFDAEAPLLRRLDSMSLETPAGPGSHLELHLLGASHEIVLTVPCGGSREVVACLHGEAPGLPARLTRRAGGVHHRFTSEVRRLTVHRFANEVAALRDRLAGHPHALVGVFPGEADAVTALLASPGTGRIGWQTWHTYPQTGEIAVTRSIAVLEVAP